METELCRNMKNKDAQHATILQRWRKKVFDSMLTSKRFELLIEENVKTFTKDSEKLVSENEELQSKL